MSNRGEGAGEERRGPTAAAGASIGARIRRAVVPTAYEADTGLFRKLGWIVAAALLIRLPLMPIAAHVDLISTYHRSYLILHDFRPRYWVPHEILQAFFLMLYAPFLALSELLGWGINATASFDFWIDTFVRHPDVHRAFFLFKIPYLLCDLGIAAVLLRFFADEPARGVKAAAMWLLNPIAIFAFYVFGRHDAVTLLLVVIGLRCLQGSHFARGALALGAAIWARYYPIFYLPFLFATVTGRLERKAGLVALAAVPVIVYNVVTVWLDPIDATASTSTALGQAPFLRASSSSFASYLVFLRLDMGWGQGLFVFPTLATALVLYALTVERGSDPTSWLRRFVEYCAVFLLVLYATSFFHPQYFTWLLPFLVILRAQDGGPVLRNLHYLQIALFPAYTFFWGKPLAGYLFASLDPDFFAALPAPWDVVARYAEPDIAVNLVRSAMTATCLFMAGWILWNRRKDGSAPVPS